MRWRGACQSTACLSVWQKRAEHFTVYPIADKSFEEMVGLLCVGPDVAGIESDKSNKEFYFFLTAEHKGK